MAFNEQIKQLTTQTSNLADNFNDVTEKLLENTKVNKQAIADLEASTGNKLATKVNSSTFTSAKNALEDKDENLQSQIREVEDGLLTKVSTDDHDEDVARLENSILTASTDLEDNLADFSSYTRDRFVSVEKAIGTASSNLDEKFTGEITKVDGKITDLKEYTDASFNNMTQDLDEAFNNVGNALDNKIKLNGVNQENVDFIGNEIVQDGLVDISYSTKDGVENEYTAILKFKVVALPMSNFIGGTSPTFGGWALSSGLSTPKPRLYYRDDSSVNTLDYLNLDVFEIGKRYELIFKKIGNSFTISMNGKTQTLTVNNISYRTDTFRIFEAYKKATSLSSEFCALYNRILTPQEIQHNLSVLNNSPSISSITTTDSSGVKTPLLLATDTDHVETRTGHTEEERYTALLKTMSKKFTSSDGSEIEVNNAIENQRVLSGEIKGQTIKNYANWKEWLSDRNSYYTVNPDNSVQIIKEDQLNWANIQANVNLDAGVYYIFGDKDYRLQLANSSGVKIVDERIRKNVQYVFNLQSDLKNYAIKINSYGEDGDTVPLTINLSITKSNVERPIAFGLNSTRAIISNNSAKYEFYASEEDKANGKMIELGKCKTFYDTLYMLEDGSAVCEILRDSMLLSSSLGFKVTTPDDGKSPWFQVGIPKMIRGTTYWVSEKYSECIKYSTDPEVDGYMAYNGTIRFHKPSFKGNLTLFNEWLDSQGLSLNYVLDTPIITNIPKQLVPTIATNKTMILQASDAVKASEFSIEVPVDKVSELEARLSAIEAINL